MFGIPPSVVTAPSGVTSRIMWLSRSATSTLPAPSTTTAAGPLNRAAPLIPSSPPFIPAQPASVVTSPPGTILRSVWLPVSATKMFPSRSTATPVGVLNRAAAPAPSARPAVPARPASVATSPFGETLRIT